MNLKSWRRIALTAAAVLAVGAFAALPLLRQYLSRKESNPILRGRVLAEQVGCYACHRSFGAAEIPNPGSRWGSVPAFGAGNAMMYAESCAEIGEFIRFGAPRVWLDSPAAAARLESQQLRMPAYGQWLTDSQVTDLAAFACAVEGVDLPSGEGAVAGRALAKKHGCLACHGPEGSGGLPNPRSLGGFIPAFAGGNFPDLVQDEAEFREWVTRGTSSRLAARPIIRYFWNRQAIQMPAYGEELSEEEIVQLWQWVQEVRAQRHD